MASEAQLKPTPSTRSDKSTPEVPMTFRFKAAFMWKKCWKPFLTILFPLVLSLLFLWEGIDVKNAANPKWKQSRGAFVVLLMACYWVSECLPLPVTSLAPVYLCPLMGIMDTENVTSAYLNNSVMLLIGGCIVALSFEYSNLHTRIALKVATIVGAKVPLLLFGTMMTSMFLSMWMNNTSTTAMMVPIVYVIMEEFANANIEIPIAEGDKPLEPTPRASHASALVQRKSAVASDNASRPSVRQSTVTNVLEQIKIKKDKEARNIKIMFLLGVAWASNIGGTGIITGTATNVITQNAADSFIADLRDVNKTRVINAEKCIEAVTVSFLGWLVFNVVPMLISTLLTWVVLLLYFTGIPHGLKNFRKQISPFEQKEIMARKKISHNIENAIRAKYSQLGPISLHEILVLLFFILLVVLWITENVSKSIAWDNFFLRVAKGPRSSPNASNATAKPQKAIPYTTPAVPVMFICIFLFILPKDKKYYKDFFNGGLSHGMKDPILPWREVEKSVPWGPLILIGGGVAISKTITESGLKDAISEILKTNKFLLSLSPPVFLLVVLLIVAVLTTIASNTATAAILSPVLISASQSQGVHPLYLLETATVSASYAFILPISTPPNAIVFDKSDMKQVEMAIPGLIVTVLTNVVLFGMVHSYDEVIFGFNEYRKYKYCSKIGG